MKKLLISVVAASAMLAAAHPAGAATFSYEFSAATATLGGNDYDLTGTFTDITSASAPYNTSTAVNIALTSTTGTDKYYTVGSIDTFSTSRIAFWDPTIDSDLIVALLNNPTNAIDPIEYVEVGLDCTYNGPLSTCTGGTRTSTAQAGSIDPTPITSTAVLFVTGLGLLGFMGYWRKRRMGLNLNDARQFA
jgi:hypothetical protein